MLIRDQKIFEDLLNRCREHGSFAFDTEFLRENTYWPELCLIQIGIEGEAFAVDPLAEDIDCGSLQSHGPEESWIARAVHYQPMFNKNV